MIDPDLEKLLYLLDFGKTNFNNCVDYIYISLLIIIMI